MEKQPNVVYLINLMNSMVGNHLDGSKAISDKASVM